MTIIVVELKNTGTSQMFRKGMDNEVNCVNYRETPSIIIGVSLIP